jgi:hypothetical protein
MMNSKGFCRKRSCTIPPYAWKDWGNPRKTSIRIADLRVEIWTRDLPNTEQVLTTRPRRVVFIVTMLWCSFAVKGFGVYEIMLLLCSYSLMKQRKMIFFVVDLQHHLILIFMCCFVETEYWKKRLLSSVSWCTHVLSHTTQKKKHVFVLTLSSFGN